MSRPGLPRSVLVVASNPVGSLTGTAYPDSLIRADFGGIQPRIGRRVASPARFLAGRSGGVWCVPQYLRLPTGSSLLLAQQPPLSKSFSIQNEPSEPADPGRRISQSPRASLPTPFAVDPDLSGWLTRKRGKCPLQRDLPESLTVLATYLRTRGKPVDAGVPAEHVSRRRSA